jgi:hypothetical protein
MTFVCAVLAIFVLTGSGAGRAEPRGRPEVVFGLAPAPEVGQEADALCQQEGHTYGTEEYDMCYSARIMWLIKKRCHGLGLKYGAPGFGDCIMREGGLPPMEEEDR